MSVKNVVMSHVFNFKRYLMMENLFDSSVLVVTLISIAASLFLLGTILSGDTALLSVSDKSNLYTDIDDTL